MNKNNLIFVDCEATGPAIGKGELSEFGAVAYPSMETFYGNLKELIELDKEILILSKNKSNSKIFKGLQNISEKRRLIKLKVFVDFDKWLKKICNGYQPVFISDNPAFDWQWINYHFCHFLGYNPFGWSARRIGDYYAGLTGNFRNATKWKKLRITKHTHNPVDDAMGNAEAFKRIQNGER